MGITQKNVYIFMNMATITIINYYKIHISKNNENDKVHKKLKEVKVKTLGFCCSHIIIQIIKRNIENRIRISTLEINQKIN